MAAGRTWEVSKTNGNTQVSYKPMKKTRLCSYFSRVFMHLRFFLGVNKQLFFFGWLRSLNQVF